MSVSQATPDNQIPQSQRRRGGQRHFAPRHQRGPRPQTMDTQLSATSVEHASAGNSSLTFRPASVAPTSISSSAEPSSAEASATENGTSRGTRDRGRGQARGGASGRRGAGIARGGRGYQGPLRTHSNRQAPGRSDIGSTNAPPQVNGHSTLVNSGRRFGGHLTEISEPSRPTNTSLQADAPEFYPGQPHQQRLKNQGGGKMGTGSVHQEMPRKAPRGRRQSILKSTAADIATRTHDDINSGAYECPICTNEVVRNSRVWSCKTCWTVFHLTCIKKWSTNEGSTLALQRNEEGELPPPRQWRCPGCNLPKNVLPSNYTCWCEKETDPRPISGIPPHSCGQTCGKTRILPKKCPHPCELLCHAGPCPPCTHVGPEQICFCGKKSMSRRCVDTNYDTGWSCGQICGDLMPCGEHTDHKPCHEGLCGACEVSIECRCYCGKVKQSILCCERGDEKQSQKSSDGSLHVEEWTGMFDCKNGCQRVFDCGIHHCEKKCHPQELGIPPCPLSPEAVSHCPCGKTPLEEIATTPRKNCQDSVPNCEKRCLRQLPCGHPCQQICHSGECIGCRLTVDISCRCGRTKSSTTCHQGSEERPHCMRACKATLSCGRHECSERCCSGERKAAERQATKRKLRPLGASRVIDEGFEAEHICTRTCGRTLKCGNHTCQELCHRGPCGSCREAIFEDVSCNCGKTILQPPLPCGTAPPPCRFDCERPKSCGHPRIPHNCHADNEVCPKCPFLSQKPCLCGKKTLSNQPCWLTEVRCGDVCGRKLKCGSHFCRKQCHRPGDCEDAEKSCQQACGKAKKVCGHPCEEPCHAPSPCREVKPCQNKMFITCDCQRIKQEIKCLALKTSEGNSKKTLTCDDECARLVRNQKLALALNVDPEALKDDHVPYSNETLKLFRENTKWAQTQEREFRVFAADETEKRLRFKPMPPHQRAFLHAISEDFGLDSESMDPEPHRHVAVFKTPRFVMAPMKTLAECVRIRTAAETSTPTVAESQRKLQTNNVPYNGFLMTQPRFGITLEELGTDFAASFNSTPGLFYDIAFLPSEEIVIKARPLSSSTVISTSAIEAAIIAIKFSLSASTSAKGLAASIQLCTLDASLNIIRRELDDSANNGGWSQVAAKAAAPRYAPRQKAVGEKSVYTVLGSKLRDAKKKKEEIKKAKEQEEVVDDWEEEVKKEEEAEEIRKVAADDKDHLHDSVQLTENRINEQPESTEVKEQEAQ